jgi:hypothetical protein
MAGACYVHQALGESYSFPATVGACCLLISWMSIDRKKVKSKPKKLY